MTRMERLRKVVMEIEKQNDTQELTDLAVYLNNFRERLQVRSMGIAEQTECLLRRDVGERQDSPADVSAEPV